LGKSGIHFTETRKGKNGFLHGKITKSQRKSQKSQRKSKSRRWNDDERRSRISNLENRPNVTTETTQKPFRRRNRVPGFLMPLITVIHVWLFPLTARQRYGRYQVYTRSHAER
jgi:hypothetical protein